MPAPIQDTASMEAVAAAQLQGTLTIESLQTHCTGFLSLQEDLLPLQLKLLVGELPSHGRLLLLRRKCPHQRD